MKLDRTTACNLIDINAPRWKDKTVLIADWKVGTHNEIRINTTRKDGSKFFPEPFYMSGDVLREYPTQPHSYRRVYIVPLADLEILERS